MKIRKQSAQPLCFMNESQLNSQKHEQCSGTDVAFWDFHLCLCYNFLNYSPMSSCNCNTLLLSSTELSSTFTNKSIIALQNKELEKAGSDCSTRKTYRFKQPELQLSQTLKKSQVTPPKYATTFKLTVLNPTKLIPPRSLHNQ
ncbi:hypothetical protein pdam_00006066 [Pocillopora damicornis]|uniref:Uncharacterized protein n=1 Tax=Pocillopora damicornis TaxID=46731 RepID=A0A3M6TT00_POCDA|nr:hypothetical protein pdam_00006066 [Pocillopora damicornis]